MAILALPECMQVLSKGQRNLYYIYIFTSEIKVTNLSVLSEMELVFFPENYGPPQILYHRNNQNLKASLGQRIRLNCEVKYFFMYAIKWRKNEEYIEGNGHYILHSEKARRPTYSNIKFKVTNWFLDIPNLDEEDFGNYTCEATNRFGEDAVTFTVVKQAT